MKRRLVSTATADAFTWMAVLALVLFVVLFVLAGCSCQHERWTAEVRDLPAEHAARWPGVALPTRRCAVYSCPDCGQRVGTFEYGHPWNGPPWGGKHQAEDGD